MDSRGDRDDCELLFSFCWPPCAGWLGPRTAEAAATKKLALTPAEAKVFVAWTHFLSDGATTWSTKHAPAFTPDISTTIWQVLKTDTQAQSLANPMIDYLLWRQSLDPQRFAANHPNLSPALAQLLNTPSLPAGVPPRPTRPFPSQPSRRRPYPVPPPPTAAPGPLPPAVPEPSSLLLAVTMTGLGLLWRHRLGKARQS